MEKQTVDKMDPKKILVAPSLLAANFANLESELKRIEDAGADLLHLDIMDGHFVPNLTMGPPVISAIRKICKLPFDVHLMLTDPLKYVEPFSKAGADLITFHIECDNDPDEVISAIRSQGISVGISVKPKTPASAIEKFLDKIDLALVMSMEPGFGGQSFMSEVVPKIAQIRKMADKVNPRLHVEVDGGIDGKTVNQVVPAGANMLVAGTAVFRAPDGAEAAIGRLHAAQDLLPK